MGLLLAACGTFVGARHGASGSVLIQWAALNFALGCAGAWWMSHASLAPIFEHRVEWATIFTLMLIGPMLETGLTRGHRTVAPISMIGYAVVVAPVLFAFVWLSSSPRRGRGWLARLRARQSGWPLCAHCGMATSSKRACVWCGHPTAGEDPSAPVPDGR
jgi:hypothetical protein